MKTNTSALLLSVLVLATCGHAAVVINEVRDKGENGALLRAHPTKGAFFLIGISLMFQSTGACSKLFIHQISQRGRSGEC